MDLALGASGQGRIERGGIPGTGTKDRIRRGMQIECLQGTKTSTLELKESLMARTKKPVREQVRVRGFARVQIGEHDPHTGKLAKIVGDSGWFENTITTDGKNSYLAAKTGSVTGSKTPGFLFLGTQTNAVNSTQTTLSGDLTAYPAATNGRKAITASTAATGSLQMTASWSSTDNGTATTIGGLGVVDISTTASFSMGAGQTFATSAWATNQNVSASYNWNFAWWIIAPLALFGSAAVSMLC